MENGSPIESNLANIEHFYNRGVRYITLVHSKCNHISDSSFDPERKWNGLSPFGREVVDEMNRIGMMIDVSHASDKAFYQILDLSKAPVVATHSACRYFTPGRERNMNDEMIRLLADKGGTIQIAFGSSFINPRSYMYRHYSPPTKKEIDTLLFRVLCWLFNLFIGFTLLCLRRSVKKAR